MRVAQKFAGYSLEEADNLRKACGQEDPGHHRRPSARSSWPAASPRATGERSARSSSTSSSPSPTTPSTSRTPTATGSSPTRRPGSRPTTRSSTWPPCSRRSRTTRTRPRSTWPSAGPWASRCWCPTSTGRPSDFTAPRAARTGEGRRIVFGLAAVRNVGEGLVERIVAEREAERPVRRLLRLLPAGRPDGAQQAHRRVADQGRGLRLPRPSRARACAWSSRRSSTAP